MGEEGRGCAWPVISAWRTPIKDSSERKEQVWTQKSEQQQPASQEAKGGACHKESRRIWVESGERTWH